MSSGSDFDDFGDDTNVVMPETLVERKASSEQRGSFLVLAGSNTGEMFIIEKALTVMGRTADADFQIADPGVSRKHCQLERVGDKYVFTDLGSRNGSFINGTRIIGSVELTSGDKLQLGRTTVIRFSLQDELDEQFQQQLLDSALRDAMTGAYNRRYFLNRLDSEFKFATRHDQPLALLLFDIDHFKQINDTRGHLAGDKALVDFSNCIHDTIRNEDVFARYGGEEFAVIARSISAESALQFAERLRKAVESLQFEDSGQTWSMTVSIGIASLPAHPVRDSVELLAAADRALYVAKRKGRNRVAVYTVTPPDADPDDTTLT